MKKEIIVSFILVALLIPLSTAGLFDWFKKNIDLAPSQPTDVRIEVGNVGPSITSISSIPAVDLNSAPSSTAVAFTFSASDPNGVSDLNDASASANFTKLGEELRSSACSFLSQTGNERTYSCSINMQYYDSAGTWTVSVSIKDQANLMGSSSSTFNVNLLRSISISPATINFPTVVQGAANIISSVNTQVTNNGNFVVPTNGGLSITANNLIGESTSTENIPASNFRAAGSSESSTVCTTGDALVASTSAEITNINLPRGASGNTEDIAYCLTLVPSSISSQFYSATGGNAWTISI